MRRHYQAYVRSMVDSIETFHSMFPPGLDLSRDALHFHVA